MGMGLKMTLSSVVNGKCAGVECLTTISGNVQNGIPSIFCHPHSEIVSFLGADTQSLGQHAILGERPLIH